MMTAHTTPGTRHQAVPRLLQPIKFPVHKSGFGPRPTPGELLLLLLLLTALLRLFIWSKALRTDANQQIATTAYSVCHDPHCNEGSETPVATLVTSWLPSICEGCAALIGASIGGGGGQVDSGSSRQPPGELRPQFGVIRNNVLASAGQRAVRFGEQLDAVQQRVGAGHLAGKIGRYYLQVDLHIWSHPDTTN